MSNCLHSTWLAFMGKDVHPALASREAENEYIENLSERLLPIILKVVNYNIILIMLTLPLEQDHQEQTSQQCHHLHPHHHCAPATL